MIVTIIVAAAANNAIGKNNELIWHLSADLKRFKRLTTGHHIIMGRKTFESIGKPLPNRTTIIITRNKDYTQDGCLVAHSLDEALAKVKNDANPFIIGGAEIYKQAMDIASKIELTRIEKDFEGDAFFPEISPKIWMRSANESHTVDDNNDIPYRFETWIKK